ncbi:sigma-54-dependent Fis family transcriptional regulator [bacterium]|nr:sigma-54-dependent Fis family transcriptional regulator [bacterium]
MRRLLIVEDNSSLRETVMDYFKMKGDFVKGSTSVKGALDLLKKDRFDIVITDLKLEESSGIELIKIVKSSKKNIEIIVVTGMSSIDIAIEAVRAGAFQYLMKPFKLEELELFIEKAYEKLGLEKEVSSLREKLIDKYNFNNIIAVSSVMESIFQKIKQIAPTDASVLITGESGVGKELIARAIHYNSLRRDGPLMPINCSALPDTLLESELFGFKKGAFTDASADKKGKFEMAEGGTLFLDEIGELSLFTQVKLLRFLETKEIMPIGGTHVSKVDTRLVFATNTDLKAAIENKKFREDFYYRIKVVNLHIPPLRERREDIFPLANHFMIEYCRKYGKALMNFSSEAIEKLENYNWLGNVRELKNIIENIVIFNSSESITCSHLPENIKTGNAAPDITRSALPHSVELKEIEKMAIIANLIEYKKNHTKVARVLGISRPTLLKKIKLYEINEEEL